jgi:hypothetical protein
LRNPVWLCAGGAVAVVFLLIALMLFAAGP